MVLIFINYPSFREYKALLQDIVRILLLEKGVNHPLLEEKMSKFKDDMLTFTSKPFILTCLKEFISRFWTIYNNQIFGF